MGCRPGDRYCDLCGEIAAQPDELVTLTRDSYEGGRAEICRACRRRPIADLVALMDDPMHQVRPVSRPSATRNFSVWDRLFR